MPAWFSTPLSTSHERDLLQPIVDFRLPLGGRTFCIDDLRDSVKVVFSDERKKEPEDLSLADVIKSLETLKAQKEKLDKQFKEAREGGRFGELDEIGAKSYRVSSLISSLEETKSDLEKGIPPMRILFGEFDPASQQVYIYYRNIEEERMYSDSAYGICAVLVHEMFHAWNYLNCGGACSTVTEIDEPMVEFSTLYFLDKACEENPGRMMERCLNWQECQVRGKQSSSGITAAYGFGNCLNERLRAEAADKRASWIEAYSTKSSSIAVTDAAVARIRKSLNPAYPVEVEDRVLSDFRKVIFGAKTVTGTVKSGTVAATPSFSQTDLLVACIKSLGKADFNVADVYAFKPVFETIYPDNRNIEAKIRQLLQTLVKESKLTRTRRGDYHVVSL